MKIQISEFAQKELNEDTAKEISKAVITVYYQLWMICFCLIHLTFLFIIV